MMLLRISFLMSRGGRTTHLKSLLGVLLRSGVIRVVKIRRATRRTRDHSAISVRSGDIRRLSVRN
jgi:hypothetical protein